MILQNFISCYILLQQSMNILPKQIQIYYPFLDYQVVYTKEKGIPLVGLKCIPPSFGGWDQEGKSNQELHNPLWEMEQHVEFTTSKLASNNENFPPISDPQRRKSTPQLNQVFLTIKRGMWIYETLKTIMNVVERGTHSRRKDNRHGTSQ